MPPKSKRAVQMQKAREAKKKKLNEAEENDILEDEYMILKNIIQKML